MRYFLKFKKIKVLFNFGSFDFKYQFDEIYSIYLSCIIGTKKYPCLI